MQNYKKYLYLPKNSSNFVAEMKKISLILTIIMCIWVESVAQNTFFASQYPPQNSDECSPSTPLHEMRAVWLTTIGGIDWPHSYAQSAYSAKKQQKELCDILDLLVAAGYNTVLLQTRVRATTIFPSNMEPWDGCLSGFPGQSPGYDALAFAIEECHKRGMKLHAWVVSIPVGKWNKTGCINLRKTCPELLKKIGDEGYMNPEASGTAAYIARFCRDIVSRYDVDGIHLDYIRYPETWGTIQNHDRGRANITRIVSAVHDAVKSIKPWVMMSCSPIGKYADTKRTWSHGWNARDVVCQDAAQWLADGLMDALFPMMYFRGDNFYPFAIDWMERSSGKVVCPGLGIYFMHPTQKNWPLQDITQEMNVLRQYQMGNAFFRSKFFTDNTKGLYKYTKNIFSPQPALQPSMWWYHTALPQSPSALKATPLSDGSIRLSWDAPYSSDVDGQPLQYNIYGTNEVPLKLYDSDNLLAGNYIGNSVIIPKSSLQCFAVTSTDRYGKESKAVAYIPDAMKEAFQKGNSNIHESNRKSWRPAFLSYEKNTLWLDHCDVTNDQLIEIRSIMGNAQYLRIAHRIGNRLGIDITLPAGNYGVYLINKKQYRHKLGVVSVKP